VEGHPRLRACVCAHQARNNPLGPVVKSSSCTLVHPLVIIHKTKRETEGRGNGFHHRGLVTFVLGSCTSSASCFRCISCCETPSQDDRVSLVVGPIVPTSLNSARAMTPLASVSSVVLHQTLTCISAEGWRPWPYDLLVYTAVSGWWMVVVAMERADWEVKSGVGRGGGGGGHWAATKD
jgi:hypothetical protein